MMFVLIVQFLTGSATLGPFEDRAMCEDVAKHLKSQMQSYRCEVVRQPRSSP